MVWYTYLNDFDINFWVMYKNNKTNTKSALLLKLIFYKTQLQILFVAKQDIGTNKTFNAL